MKTLSLTLDEISELAKKAAKKGDHEAYKKHAKAAKEHDDAAKGASKDANKSGPNKFNAHRSADDKHKKAALNQAHQ